MTPAPAVLAWWSVPMDAGITLSPSAVAWSIPSTSATSPQASRVAISARRACGSRGRKRSDGRA